MTIHFKQKKKAVVRVQKKIHANNNHTVVKYLKRNPNARINKYFSGISSLHHEIWAYQKLQKRQIWLNAAGFQHPRLVHHERLPKPILEISFCTGTPIRALAQKEQETFAKLIFPHLMETKSILSHDLPHSFIRARLNDFRRERFILNAFNSYLKNKDKKRIQKLIEIARNDQEVSRPLWLHGDFHLGNILKDGSGYCVLDFATLRPTMYFYDTDIIRLLINRQWHPSLSELLIDQWHSLSRRTPSHLIRILLLERAAKRISRGYGRTINVAALLKSILSEKTADLLGVYKIYND